MNGQIKEGYKEGDPILNHQNLYPIINDKVHAVVIVLDATSIGSKLALEDYVKLIKEVQSLGHRPLVLLTKFDMYCKNKLGLENSDCSKFTFFANGMMEEATEEFMNNTGNCIPSKNFILFAINYTGPFLESDELIEFLSLYNLNTIKDAAINYLKTFQKNCVLIYTASQEYIGFTNFNSMDDTLEEIKDQIKKVVKSKEFGQFNFLNLKNEDITKEKEKTIKLIEISTTIADFPFKSIKINLLKESEEKPKSHNIVEVERKNNDSKEKIAKKKTIQEDKPEIFITLVSINQKNEMEKDVYAAKLNKFLSLKNLKEDYKKNSSSCLSYSFNFLDAEFEKIESKNEESTQISDILIENENEYYIYLKLHIFPTVIIRNKRGEDLGILADVPMNIKLCEFKESLKSEDECKHLAPYRFFKNSLERSCPLPIGLEKTALLEDIGKKEDKDLIVIMEEQKN